MTHLFIVIAALSAIYAGMSGLCLAMERHFSQVFAKDPTPFQQRWLRVAGWLLLGLSLVLSVRAWGGAIGPFVWIGALTAMTGVLVFLFAYRHRLALPAAGVSLALAMLAGLASVALQG